MRGCNERPEVGRDTMSDDLTAVYLLGAYEASREWRDAAEFEARVAAFISDNLLCENYCLCDEDDDPEQCLPYRLHNLTCSWCRMRFARLEVEELWEEEGR